MDARDRALVVLAVLAGMVAGSLAAVTSGASASDPRPSWEAVERQAVEGTVLVEAEGCSQDLVGSGFVLRGGLVVTAAHVLGGSASASVSGDRYDARPLRAPLVDDAHDVATGAVDHEGGLVLSEDHPRVGDEVFVSGRPGGGPVFARPARVLGAVAGRGHLEPPLLLRLDTRVSPGESGGPVLDAGGEVAGMVVEAEEGTGLALVVPVADLTPAIDALGSGDRAPGCIGSR